MLHHIIKKSIGLFLCITAVISFASNDFYMAFTADPQLAWYCGAGTACAQETPDKMEQAIISNFWQTYSINKFVEQYGEAFKGVIVNGDLTAYGHEDEFKWYQDYFVEHIKVPMFPGLGNHDYSNNVDDCEANNCARRMVDYMYDYVNKMKPKAINFDFKVSKMHYKFPYLRVDHKGSLAYSFDIEGVHFIQLHNYPSYKRYFEGWNLPKARMEQYTITSSFPWLENDLKQAHEAGKTIIINMHDLKDHMSKADRQHLIDLMEQYQVSSVFWGYVHNLVRKETITSTISGFRCGSSPYNTYLLAHFKDNKLYEVSAIDSSYGETKVIETYPLTEEK